MPEHDLIMGFNSPPSQSQLHLQCIAPMMVPFQYAEYLREFRHHSRRFFSVSYVLDLLTRITEDVSMVASLPHNILSDDQEQQHKDAMAAKGRMTAFQALLQRDISTAEDAEEFVPSVDAVISFAAKTYSLDYELYDIAFKKQTEMGQEKFASWRASDGSFKGTVISTMSSSSKSHPLRDAYLPLLKFFNSDTQNEPPAPKELIHTDKLILQDYGRPYDSNSQPTGSYIPRPVPIDHIDVW